MSRSRASAFQAGPWAIRLLLVAVPLLGAGYQVAAKKAAAMLPMGGSVPHLLGQAVGMPWVWILIVLEAASFAGWLVVLSKVKLSAAFPLTAFGYVLVIALSWLVFGERLRPLQFVGVGAILVGVWLLRGSADGAEPRSSQM